MRRHTAKWTQEEEERLIGMVMEGKSSAVIARTLGRSPLAVKAKVYRLRLARILP